MRATVGAIDRTVWRPAHAFLLRHQLLADAVGVVAGSLVLLGIDSYVLVAELRGDEAARKRVEAHIVATVMTLPDRAGGGVRALQFGSASPTRRARRPPPPRPPLAPSTRSAHAPPGSPTPPRTPARSIATSAALLLAWLLTLVAALLFPLGIAPARADPDGGIGTAAWTGCWSPASSRPDWCSPRCAGPIGSPGCAATARRRPRSDGRAAPRQSAKSSTGVSSSVRSAWT